LQYHVLGFNLHRSQRGGRGFESPLVHHCKEFEPPPRRSPFISGSNAKVLSEVVAL